MELRAVVDGAEGPALVSRLDRGDRGRRGKGRDVSPAVTGGMVAHWPDMADEVYDFMSETSIIQFPRVTHEEFAAWLTVRGVYFVSYTPPVQSSRRMPAGWEYRVYTFGVREGDVPAVEAKMNELGRAARASLR